MNATAIRTAGKYLAIYGAIGFSVVLLSVLFNILGTITAAVLVGMMLGAFKGARGFSVWVSLVFPAVILGLAQSARVGLAQRQLILLAALCFSAFWVTYLVSACVFFCEQRNMKSPQLVASGCTLVGGPARESCLAQLDGDWVSAGSSAGEPLYKKIIQIKEARLELRAVDACGHVTLLARGDVRLQSLRPAQALAIPQAASEPGDFIIGL